jgi:hypothetical protein
LDRGLEAFAQCTIQPLIKPETLQPKALGLDLAVRKTLCNQLVRIRKLPVRVHEHVGWIHELGTWMQRRLLDRYRGLSTINCARAQRHNA